MIAQMRVAVERPSASALPLLVRAHRHLIPQVDPVSNLTSGSCYLLLGEPDIIRPESSGRLHHEAPVAESGRGFVAPIWRGFQGISALSYGPPGLLTGRMKDRS